MPPLVIANAALVTIHWARGDVAFINQLGALAPAGVVIGQTMANDLGIDIKAALASTALSADLHTSVSLVAVGVRDIRVAFQPEFVDSSPAVSGTAAGDPLPGSVALVVTFRTGLSGPRNRGRYYQGGLTEAANDASGQCSAIVSGHILSFVDGVRVAIAGAGMTMAVVSRPQLATVVTKEIAARPGGVQGITSLQIRNNTWDSQRRRASAGAASTFRASDSITVPA